MEEVKMCDIDKIMDMLDWNNSIEVQERGIELAKKVKSINVFIQPGDTSRSKSLWDNCAKVLSTKSDEELRPYLTSLLEWLIDLNWPGALLILDRIKKMDKEASKFAKNECIKKAKALGEEIWLQNLLEIDNKKTIY